MKRLFYQASLLGVCCFLLIANVRADIRVSITGSADAAVRAEIEKNTSLLLNEINNAYQQHRNSLNVKRMDCADMERFDKRINLLWKNVHFYPMDNMISTPCLQTAQGYQIRNIRLMFVPQDTVIDSKSALKEGVINFTMEGKIDHFTFADDTIQGSMMFAKAKDVVDLTRKMQILDFVEHFRYAYTIKDIDYIEQTFSEDALIITGTIIAKYKEATVVPAEGVSYRKQDKTAYINNLRRIFYNNKYIDVKFEEIEIKKHPNLDRFYGVWVKQTWTTDHYGDIGYVFMLWDFRNEEHPVIHVRTWQPANVKEEDLFGPADFKLVKY